MNVRRFAVSYRLLLSIFCDIFDRLWCNRFGQNFSGFHSSLYWIHFRFVMHEIHMVCIHMVVYF